jgi:molybdate transport system permease protein
MTTIQISDPNNHTHYNCFPATRDCELGLYGPTTSTGFDVQGAAATGPLPDDMGYSIHEDLGKQLTSGLETVGTRENTIYNPGVFGNDRKITVSREFWFSPKLGINLISKRSDPRFGTQTFTITNLILSEPDPQLFELPEGYKVVDLRPTPVSADISPPSSFATNARHSYNRDPENRLSMESLILSIRLALCVSVILFVIGMPLAYWLAYSHWRGKFLVESVVALPLVLPPTVLGFYVLVAMGPRGPLGKLWQAVFGHGLAFTFIGLVFASVLYSLPFAVQPLVASLERVDRKLLEASAVLGASRVRTFWRVILPLSVPGVVTALVLSFAHTLGEFGVVLMVGGNLPGVTRTVSIDIYDHVQSLEYAQANRMALVLLVFSFVVLSVVYGVNRQIGRRVWSPWPAK